MASFSPCCRPVGIGSLPHRQVDAAVELIGKTLPTMPFWPQLPNHGYLENMYAQYGEQFPGLVIDREKEQLYVDLAAADFPRQLEKFYELVMAGDPAPFAISDAYAAGLRPALEFFRRPENAGRLKLIKGQVTGPISFGLTVTTADRKSIIYNDTLAEVLVQQLLMKARWQEELFRQFFPGLPTMIFFDEPYMVSFGTAFCALARESVVAMLNEVFAGLAGLSGVHCCGNTDWSLLLATGVDVLNFDAYEYVDNLFLYRDELGAFLERGGCLAWGIVPTSEAAWREDVDSLCRRFTGYLDELAAGGFDRELLLARSFITPSCGCGSLPVPLAEHILQLTSELAARIRDVYDLGD
ncbi:MAG: methionine synthase [Deltaproteobacteria bacterium]|nr:methionine synthase [Deltaproteobacteria bacterium]